MFKLSKSTISHLIILSIAGGIFLTNPISPIGPTEVNATALAFVINASNFGTLTNNGLEKTGTTNPSNVEVSLGTKNSFKSVTGQTTFIELNTRTGIIYNTTPLPGTITSVNIKQRTGITNTLYIGNTSRLVNNISGDITVSNNIPALNLSVSGTSQDFTSTTFSSYSNLSYFAFLSSSGNNSGIESITFNMIVNEVIVSNYKVFNFASDIFFYTDNKQGQCNETDLNWGTLTSLWNSLSDSEKTLFRTSTSDQSIINARARYIYLRTVNPNLVNFIPL